MQQVQISCGDFQRNYNGTWISRVHTTINGVAVLPGISFRKDEPFNGIDVAAWLDEHCR
jgi:hypothetical protein